MIAYFKNLYKNRELLQRLCYREISVKYKQSFLGFAWAVLRPVIYMLIFMAIKGSGAVSVDSGTAPYALFTYAALLPWTLFVSSVTSASSSVVANSGILQKIYFPREIFPTAAVLAPLLDFFIAAVVYVGLMIYYGIYPSSQIILLPALLCIQMLLALGLGILLSGLAVFRRDFVYATGYILQFMLFLTPVMYSIQKIPQKYMNLYLWLNPMAGIIESYRYILIYKQFPPSNYYLWPLGLSAVLFVISFKIFKKMEGAFADVV